MICTVIQDRDLDGVMQALECCEMAEIRLDRCRLSTEDIEECFSSDVPLVATCRLADVMEADGSLSMQQALKTCEERLLKAVDAGAAYVDVEMEIPKEVSKRIRARAHSCGTVFIRSVHDFNATGTDDELRAQVEKCRYYGADIVKIVTMAHSAEDAARVMRLYDEYDPASIIAFCMGEYGRDSRVECLAKGAPYSYAALSEAEAAAPGQLTASDMAAKVYGDMRFVGYGPANASREVRMPASKSFAQRAILAAALAEGISTLDGYSPCSDSESAIRVARSLGAEVRSLDNGRTLEIRGVGAVPGSVGTESLNVGESGLLTRLMIPLSAVVASISGKDGSQLISGLLMALPLAGGKSTVTVTDPKSIPYMFITLDVIRRFGVDIANEMSGGREFFESDGDWSLCREIIFNIRGGQRYRSARFSLEGDWSAAANFLVAGAVFGRAEIAGLDTTSLQADLSIMDILMDAGASLSQTGGDTGTITVQRAPLTAFSIDASNCPDLFPIVAVLAAFCQGTSRISGVDRLAHKESDRGAAILQMLSQMGVNASVQGNDMLVEGHSLARRCLTGTLLKGGKYTSHHDHRMVMALKVAGLGADGRIEIDDEECVGKSFPGFMDAFALMKNMASGQDKAVQITD